jgi:hypothetical protein
MDIFADIFLGLSGVRLYDSMEKWALIGGHSDGPERLADAESVRGNSPIRSFHLSWGRSSQELALPLQRVEDPHQRFIASPLSQIANPLEREVLPGQNPRRGRHAARSVVLYGPQRF